MAAILRRRSTLAAATFLWLTTLLAGDEKPDDPTRDPLPEGAIARYGSARLRHGRDVTGLVYSRDGKRLVSCSGDFTVRVWDAKSGQELLTLPLYASLIQDVALSPDGTRIAATTAKHGVYIWDAESGEQLHRIKPNDRVVVFTPDGKRLLSSGGLHGIRAWNVASGEPEDAIKHEGHTVRRLAFSNDGKWLAGAGDREIYVWNWKTRKLVHTLKPQQETGVYLDVCFSSAGDRLVANTSKVVSIWARESGEELDTFAPGDGPRCVAFSPNDERIFIGSGSGNIHVWILEDKEKSFRWMGHWSVACLAVSPLGETFATGGKKHGGKHDYAIRVWPVDKRPEEVDFPSSRSSATGLSLSADGKLVAVSHADGWTRVWERESQRVRMESHAQPGDAYLNVALSPDGQWLARAGGNNIAVHKVADPKERFILKSGAELLLRGVRFTPDGKFLFSGNLGGKLFCWNVAERSLKYMIAAHRNHIWGLDISPDGQWIATSSFDRHAAVWEVQSGQQVGKWKDHEFFVRAVAFSPDGTRLASGDDRHNIAIREIATGQLIRQIDAGWSITSLGFCDGGRTLVSGHFYDRLKFWDLATGELVLEMRNRPGPFTTKICVRRAEQSLLTSLSDSTVIEWDLRPVLDKLPALPPVKLTEERQTELWKRLALGDGAAADKAIWQIVAAGDAGVAMLKKRLLRPPPKLDEAAIEKLIRELDDDQFQTRETAEKQLRDYGAEIAARLEKEARETKSAEVRFRVGRLLKRLQSGNLSPERLQAARAVYALASARSPAARAALKALAEDKTQSISAARAKHVLDGSGD